MRLFIAVNFNDETRSRLLELRDDLRGKAERGRFTVPENLHLTLVFLGECGGRQTAAAKSALEAVDFEPFDIVIDRVGRFMRGGGDVWWAGVKEHTALSALHSGLIRVFSDAGFAPDDRPFKPHITLGREVAANANPGPVMAFGETVRSIELMKSERINGRLAYDCIFRRSSLPAPVTAGPRDPNRAHRRDESVET